MMVTEPLRTDQKEEEEMEQWQRTGATRGRGSLSVPSRQTIPALFHFNPSTIDTFLASPCLPQQSRNRGIITGASDSGSLLERHTLVQIQGHDA